MEKEEKNVALVGKGKAKKIPSQGQDSNGEKKKKVMSKVKSFECGEFHHYITKCLKRKKEKKGKQVATSVEIDELTSILEEFTLTSMLSPNGGGA